MSWFRRDVSEPVSRAPGLTSYAEWSAWFDGFARGGNDDALLATAAASELAWSAATSDRYATRAVTTLETRLDRVGTMLAGCLGRARTEQDVVQAIVDARRGFSLLRRYADLACWPDALRSQLGGLIDHHVAARQQAMLKSAAGDRTGRLANAVRNTPLDRLDRAIPLPPSDPLDSAAASPNHRTILI